MAETIHTNQFLTNFATRYEMRGFVGDFVAPPFKVNRPSDKYVEYTKSSLRVYNNKIGGREKSKEISWNTTSGTYTCEEYALSFFVSNRERANADKPINLEQDAVRQVQFSQRLSREKRVADIAGNAAIITQTVNAGGDWNVVATGTPVADILTAIKTIYHSTGMIANSIVVPMSVAIEAIKTNEWKDYFKYTTSANLWDFMAGLRNLGLEPQIAGSFGLNTYEGTASDPTMEEIWGENVLVFYREVSPTLMSRTLMYSPFTERDIVRRFVKDEERGIKIEVYEEIDELLVDATSGYLITNTLT